jgi:hypothetical protein
LALLGAGFLLRAVGQALVVFAGADWLPAAEHWQSGLLPYPLLLASQLGILALIAVIVRDAWRGRGRLVSPMPRLGHAVRWFGIVYFAAMVVRYAVTMAVRPEWRWFGHSIPVLFHLVLATFLLVYSGVLLRAARAPADDRSQLG